MPKATASIGLAGLYALSREYSRAYLRRGHRLT